MRRLILASILLVFSMLCIGLIQFTSINLEEHNRVHEQIALLKDKHIALNVTILRTNLRLNQNYDPLVGLQYQIKQLQESIEGSDIAFIFHQNLELLKAITKRKFTLLEQFKSDYAILKNAEASVPTLTAELRQSRYLSLRLKEKINLFITNTLEYRLLANTALEQQLQRELIFLKAEERKLTNPEVKAQYHLLLVHAQNLINKHKSITGIFKDLYSAQVFYEIETIQRVFELNYQKKMEQGRILNFVFIALIIALLVTLVVIARRMLRTQYSLTRSNVKLNSALKELTEIQEELEKSNYLLSKQNADVVASLKYGQRIQEVHLPAHEEMARVFPRHFVYHSPKDLVSGDFYWLREQGDQVFFAVADATGHGVPGAMLSMMGIRLLDGIISQHQITEPNEILYLLDQQMNIALRQHDTNNKDGMDIALIMYNKKTKTILFSGAKNDLFYVTDEQANRVRGNRFSIGGVYHKAKYFDTTSILLDQDKAYTLYLYSDGFQDQFGGKNRRKFGAKQFRGLLQSLYRKPPLLQDDELRQALARWKSVGTQTDDILVVGIQLGG